MRTYYAPRSSLSDQLERSIDEQATSTVTKSMTIVEQGYCQSLAYLPGNDRIQVRLSSSSDSIDGFYNGMILSVNGQSKVITNYNGGTRIATVISEFDRAIRKDWYYEVYTQGLELSTYPEVENIVPTPRNINNRKIRF